MALLTYLFAFAHFSSEILIFRTAKINIPVLSPVIVASAYHSLIKVLRNLIVLSHDHHPFFYYNSYLTRMDDLAIRLLRKSMTPTRLLMASSPNNSIQSLPIAPTLKLCRMSMWVLNRNSFLSKPNSTIISSDTCVQSCIPDGTGPSTDDLSPWRKSAQFLLCYVYDPTSLSLSQNLE